MIDKGRYNLPRVQSVMDFDYVKLYTYDGTDVEEADQANTLGMNPGLYKITCADGVANYFIINPDGRKMGSLVGIKLKTAAGIVGLTKVNITVEEFWDDEDWAENPTYSKELLAADAVKGLTLYPFIEGVMMPMRIKVVMTGGGGDEYCQVVMG